MTRYALFNHQVIVAINDLQQRHDPTPTHPSGFPNGLLPKPRVCDSQYDNPDVNPCQKDHQARELRHPQLNTVNDHMYLVNPCGLECVYHTDLSSLQQQHKAKPYSGRLAKVLRPVHGTHRASSFSNRKDIHDRIEKEITSMRPGI